jgi:hypothetical protein
MKFTTGLIIGLLSVIAAVAEFILYMVFAMALSLKEPSASAFASVAIWFIFMTLAAGMIAPVCGAVESLSERKNLGLKIFLPAMIVIAILVSGLLTKSQSTQPEPARWQGVQNAR